MADESAQLRVNEALQRWRNAVIAGGLLGLLVGGIGGRLAMLALRLTSPDSVRGVTSDDGFEMGRVTLFGTFSLLAIGTAIGVLGALVFRLVAPSLIGPRWFRQATLALGTGIVIGSMLVHTDGVDFTLLEPRWFAIALFVAVPAVFGVAILPLIEAFDTPDSWLNRDSWLVWLPLCAILLFGLFAIPLALAALAVVVGWAYADGTSRVKRFRAGLVLRNGLRAGWLVVAGLSLAALVGDSAAIL